MATKKRTIDSFFTAPASKKACRISPELEDEPTGFSTHPHYPFPIRNLPRNLSEAIPLLPSRQGRVINDQPDLDLVYYEPYVPRELARRLFEFLRAELPFYRVEYTMRRGGVETRVQTPRWTTVFGIDETSCFATNSLSPGHDKELTATTSTSTSTATNQDKNDDNDTIIDAQTQLPTTHPIYTARRPRPIPECLDVLRRSVEAATGCVFNFCLVNYYASGADSISFHSDDERFLGPGPGIASFSLGARRDFLMKHKVPVVGKDKVKSGGGGGEKVEKEEEDGDKEEGKKVEEEEEARIEKEKERKEAEYEKRKQVAYAAATTFKFPLGSGDMVLMKGRTQANWLHSIPKRSSGGSHVNDGGRINITFRRAVVKGGTDNYYTYNVGRGPMYRWDKVAGEFRTDEGTGQ